LTLIDKAEVEEREYVPERKTIIRSVTSARTNIIKMLMQPWLNYERINDTVLEESLQVIDLQKKDRTVLKSLMMDYSLFNGQMIWKQEELYDLKHLIQALLEIHDKELSKVNNSDELSAIVRSKLRRMTHADINEICYILTLNEEEKENDR